MFWVDRIVEDILEKNPDKKEFIIRDEKTLSGQVHVGSLRGVIIHGLIAEGLNKRGVKARFIYEFNDADPMDGLPAYLDKTIYKAYMGKPLKDVPAPGEREYNGMKATNLAEYFGLEFLEVIHRLGFKDVEITWASKLYSEGFYDDAIKKVLAHPEEIREIYKKVSGSEKPADWMPLQVVCENCGKLGSTKVTDFDKTSGMATYVCMPDMVDWAQGCGFTGEVAPWNGRGKLPWKVEWPVKWASYHVDIEGAGKDHCASGGSHEVGERICEEVLESKVPYNIPYEFFLLGGAKMSSSKGNAASAKAISDLLPPEILRFLMSMKEPNQPIEFSPEGDTIPRLFDKHDDVAEHYFAPEEEKTYPDLDRLFYFSQIDEDNIVKRYLPRFSKLVFLDQIPRVDVTKAVTREKGLALTNEDQAELKERLHYVRQWLTTYAPESYVYKVVEDAIPESAYNLGQEQKDFLKSMAEMLRDESLSGEEIHGKTHTLVKASGLQPREAFPAIYHALLGKGFGPKAGWFIDALDRDFIIRRFEEVSALAERVKEETPPFVSDLLVVHGNVIEMFPGLKTAWVELKNVKIGKNHPRLTELINTLVTNTDWTAIKTGEFSDRPEQIHTRETTKGHEARYARLTEYKRMFKEFGVDPTKKKPSPAALVDRLAKGKDFPRINDMVDLYNYIVIKYQCSCGAFNADPIDTPFVLRFAEKGEKFQGIMDKEKPLDKGELCFFDEARLCLARDLCYLDADATKMSENVTHLYLNIDANEKMSAEEFTSVQEELVSLALEICGGEIGERTSTV